MWPIALGPVMMHTIMTGNTWLKGLLQSESKDKDRPKSESRPQFLLNSLILMISLLFHFVKVLSPPQDVSGC